MSKVLTLNEISIKFNIYLKPVDLELKNEIESLFNKDEINYIIINNSINKGESNAMYNLGYYYQLIEKNYDKMKKYYLMAIDKKYSNKLDLACYLNIQRSLK